MNVQWSGPVPCTRPVRPGLKRVELDSDEPVSKCARLSESPPSEAVGLLLGSAPGSPVSAVPARGPRLTRQGGPSRIGQFLLVPLADRDGVHSALNIDTGEELLCKEFDVNVYQEKMRAYGVLPAHSNVASILDIVVGDRRAYVFLAKEHGDLHALVKGARRLSEGRAARLFRQAAAAVAHCHRGGVVLGDLKLRKFVFGDEGRTQVKLEGLEDSRVLDRRGDDLTRDTHGCPAYVSPEVLASAGCSGSTGGSAAPYSGRAADAWSLGVMLYTMLAGRYPFHDPEPAALFGKIRRGVCCLPEGVSAGARCLLRGLLRRDPWERLTAAEALEHPWFRGFDGSGDAPFSDDSAPSDSPSDTQHREVGGAEQTVPASSSDSRADEDGDLFS